MGQRNQQTKEVMKMDFKEPKKPSPPPD